MNKIIKLLITKTAMNKNIKLLINKTAGEWE